MTQRLLITGASKGIGRACALQAAAMGIEVIAVARSQDSLKTLESQSELIQTIRADLSDEVQRQNLANAIEQPLDFVLHNAARLDAPASLKDLSSAEFRSQMAVNVEPILFLTQKLLGANNFKADSKTHSTSNSKVNSGARILAISSGAAKTAILGLSNYCTSKAAAWMATEMLKRELQAQSIWVNHYFPGVVDTEMQRTLRRSADDVFEYASEFQQYHKEKSLNTPEDVAKDILRIFTQTSDEDFFTKDWVKS